jgi:hypothetical protein
VSASTFADLRSAFTFDDDALRYRSAATGRFVSDRAVKQAINTLIDRAQREMSVLAALVANGTLDVGQFQDRFAAELKNLHLATAAAGKGGWDRMKAADFGRVGAELRFQYERLELFVRHIEAGDLSPRQITARADLYIAAANGTFEKTRRADATEVKTQERNILGVGEHCGDCLAMTRLGWVEVGALIPIGERICRGNCLCSYEFR